MAGIAVLSAGVLAGVVIGIALSLVWLIYVATAPGMPVLGREPGTQVFRDVTENPDDETFPGIVVVRLDGGLFFATADALEERIRELVAQGDEPVHAVVLDLEGVDLVDSQGAAKLAEILDFTESIDVDLRLARVKPAAASVLARDGVLDRFGAGPQPRQRPPSGRGPARRRPPGRTGQLSAHTAAQRRQPCSGGAQTRAQWS